LKGGASSAADDYPISTPTQFRVQFDLTAGVTRFTDTVQTATGAGLKANVENMTLIGSAHVNGAGNTDANLILGNTGNNKLSGGRAAPAAMRWRAATTRS
jgi:hypothetical protein